MCHNAKCFAGTGFRNNKTFSSVLSLIFLAMLLRMGEKLLALFTIPLPPRKP